MMRLARLLVGLSRRERALLALLVLLALPATLWLVVVQPLTGAREAARSALADANELRGWVEARGRELAALPPPAASLGPEPVGLSGIEARLAAGGLTEAGLGGAVQLSDAGEGAIGLRLDRIGFETLMDWLTEIEAEAGYRLAGLTLGAADAPGTVAAVIRLEPAR